MCMVRGRRRSRVERGRPSVEKPGWVVGKGGREEGGLGARWHEGQWWRACLWAWALGALDGDLSVTPEDFGANPFSSLDLFPQCNLQKLALVSCTHLVPTFQDTKASLSGTGDCRSLEP